MSARTHFVYRVFDDSGVLLYIGCTKAPRQRWSNHRSTSIWAEYADRFTMCGPYTKKEALRREAQAIENERPHFTATSGDKGHTIARGHLANKVMYAEFGGWHAYWQAYLRGENDRLERAGLKATKAADERFGPYRGPEWRLARYLESKKSMGVPA